MISIIIPTYNEKDVIDNLLINLDNLRDSKKYLKEIIIVDATNTDFVIEKRIKNNVQVLYSKIKQRATQMNKGSQYATGDILWFLHADSEVSPDSLSLIFKALTNYSHGCFSLRFLGTKNLLLYTIAFFSNIRAKYFNIILGDQGMFIKKEFFIRLNKFSNLDLFEDYDFSKRSKTIGKVKVLDLQIKTSPRRFYTNGILKTFILMQVVKVLYYLGVPNDKINKMYKSKLK